MMSDILKLIQTNNYVKAALILVGLYVFFKYVKLEGMDNVEEPLKDIEPPKEVVQGQQPAAQEQAPSSVGDAQQQQIDAIVAGKDQLNAADLLPTYDDANEFAKQNPVSNLLKEQNFLISGYHVGINTVMQSNKIPYHDLRSAPPIPKESVGPWAQSSYEVPVGAGRRGLEIL